MMLGGGMMLGLGLLMMILLVGVPGLLVVGVIAGLWRLAGRRSRPAASAFSPARYCPQCGQGLQVGWTHCPECGAAVTD